MVSLREMLTEAVRYVVRQEDVSEEDAVDTLVHKVAEWFEQDELRGVIYDGIVDYGPTTKNVVKHLAEEARR